MVTLRLEQRKMLAVTLMENFKTRQKMNVKDAAREAGSIVGFSDKTVCKYRNNFFANKGSLTALKLGKYERHCVYRDEQLNHKSAEWVRAHAFLKGEPNMTTHERPSSGVQSLTPFFPIEISLRTAIRCLRHLGSKPVSHKKGVYIDGHERKDIIRHRELLLKILEDLRSSLIGHFHAAVMILREYVLKQMTRRKNSSLFSMINQYLIQMKGKHGCGERVNDRQFFQKPKVAKANDRQFFQKPTVER